MGADLILGWLWTTQPEAIDFDKAKATIESAFNTLGDTKPSAEFLKRWDPGEVFEYYDDDDGIGARAIRDYLLDDTETLRRYWTEEEYARDFDKAQLGPVTALITGGMSWGDSPTETFDLIARWGDTPAAEAAGFYR